MAGASCKIQCSDPDQLCECPLTVAAEDAKHQPASVGTINWTVADTNVATVIPDPDSGVEWLVAGLPGEVVTAGTPIVTLLDLSKVYLRGFVPEGQIGRVKVGQAARVYLDAKPNEAVEAFVSRADPEATFTPENTYFREDRVKQVVGVKLQLKGAIGLAKPGMAADGEILVQGNEWPQHTKVQY